jgi:hypothetical protein
MYNQEETKAAAYDKLAALAAATRVKLLRADDNASNLAILNQYFHDSVSIMRRAGLTLRITPALERPHTRAAS